MKIYIVEESTWDHHDNISVFSTKDKAEAFCNLKYFKCTNTKNGDYWKSDNLGNPSYYYEILEYEVDANSS